MKIEERDREALEARARIIADWPSRGRAVGTRGVPHLLFSVGGERLALPLAAVRAYVRNPVVTRFPEGGVAMRGVVVFEGNVVTLLAVERLLGHAESASAITGAIVLDTMPPEVAIGVELEEGLEDLDLSKSSRREGILSATLEDGRGVLDARALAADPRGIIARTADAMKTEGNEA